MRSASLLALALALVAFSSAVLSILNTPLVSAAGFSRSGNAASRDTTTDASTATNTALATDTLTSTGTPAATDTPTDTPAATDTPSATATATVALTPTATLPPNPYNLDLRAAVSAAQWPQANGNWCGIATVAAIADYMGGGVSQGGVYNAMNDLANESEWGVPSYNGYGPYVAADIARDFGTDPRSIAEGLTVVTGVQYHVIVDTSSAWDTTIHIVDDVLNSGQPVSVFVDHGQHSILVSGVDATADPRTNPNAITAIHIWDPGGGIYDVGIQPSIAMDVPIQQWLSGQIGWSGSYYLAKPYASNIWNGIPLDPDPSIGPYSYQASRDNHMWVGHWVYVSAIASSATASLNADWELTPWRALYSGFATAQYPAIPAGYAGPTFPMPNNPPPPPPPVRPPVIAPYHPPHGVPPKPKPTATATATLRPLRNPFRPGSTPAATVVSYPDATTACAPVSCALAAISVEPWPIIIGAVILVLLVVLLLAPRYIPRLRAARAGAANASGSAPASPDATSSASDDSSPTLPAAGAEPDSASVTSVTEAPLGAAGAASADIGAETDLEALEMTDKSRAVETPTPISSENSSDASVEGAHGEPDTSVAIQANEERTESAVAESAVAESAVAESAVAESGESVGAPGE